MGTIIFIINLLGLTCLGFLADAYSEQGLYTYKLLMYIDVLVLLIINYAKGRLDG